MGTIYGYARCSTNETKQDIGRQVRELKAQGCTDKTIYKEYESGTKVRRAELDKLMYIVSPGDTIICTEVSRITRSTQQLCSLLEEAKQKKLKMVFGTFIVDCRGALDPMTEGMLKMMGVFAELERNMIVSRIRSGQDNARAKGVHMGRVKTSAEDVPEMFKRYYAKFITGEYNISELAKLSGVCRKTAYKYIGILKGGEV